MERSANLSQTNVKKIFDFGLLLRIIRLAKPFGKSFSFSISLSILLALVAPLRPLLIQWSINKGVGQNDQGWFWKDTGSFLLEITIIQILLLMMESIIRYVFTYTTAKLGQSVIFDLRNATYRKILHYPLNTFDRTPIGTLTTRTINDVESVNEIFSDGLIPIIADTLSIIAVLTYMFYTNASVTLVCLAPFPLLIIATYYFKESVNRSFIKVRNAVAELNAFVQEHLSGLLTLQAFTAEKKEMEKFATINSRHRDANIQAIFAYSVFFPIVELILALSIGLLVAWTAHRSFGSDSIETQQAAGIITSFILCLHLLFRPLRMIADKFNVLQMGMIAGERVFQLLDTDSEPSESGAELQQPVKGTITFEQVSFQYHPNHPVLKEVSFHLDSGKTMAIVGNTGSGKTTIISLINRLYPLTSGRILIDHQSIEDLSITTIRKHIAVVLQDVFLFSGSVMDNITLRNQQITREQVEDAAKLIGMHDFILSLPGGYDYNVMERGVTLSLGQRQMISFIRALLYNPFILILDEATSSVDTESEILIQQAINKLIVGRTSIIIAHRLSTIRKADQILVLDKGVVAEIGTHDELFSKGGLYSDLYNKQLKLEVYK